MRIVPVFFVIAMVIFTFSACGSRGVSSENIVGNDKDSHGCIASAGYTWSEVQGRCIRLWEDGIKMEQIEKVEKQGDTSYNAFLVFSTDSTKTELFDTKLGKPFILDCTKENSGIYTKGDFQVKKMNGKWVVQNGTKILNIEVK